MKKKDKKIIGMLAVLLVLLVILLVVVTTKKGTDQTNDKYQTESSEVILGDSMESEESESSAEIENGSEDLLEKSEEADKESIEPEKL